MNWATVPWNRCRAVLERKSGEQFWGRCELKAHHDGDHALERGFVIVRFKNLITFECVTEALGWCDCSIHDISESAHAEDCPNNERNW